MKGVFALLLLLGVASICHAQNLDIWEGVWTDTRSGGDLSMCVVDGILYGSYADGLGYIVGTLSQDGRAVGGLWYEAGLAEFTHGEFSWQMLLNDNAFTGIRSSDELRCAPAIWSETRLQQNAALEECLYLFDPSVLFLVNETSIAGVWTDNAGNELDLCKDAEDETESAYFEGTITGVSGLTYVHGYSYEGGRVGTAAYVNSNSGVTEGISLFLLTDVRSPQFEFNSTELTEIGFVSVNTPGEVNLLTTASFRRNWERVANEVPEFIVTNPDGTQSTRSDCQNARSLISDPWSGAWTDFDFGYGRMHTCATSNTITGIYSEIGWITGRILSDNSVTGRFYDAGDSEQVSGDFHLSFQDDFDHFTGTWEFDNSPKKYEWTESRVSVVHPSDEQCLTLSTSDGRTVEGSWQYDTRSRLDTLDLCFVDDGSRFEGSYNFNGGVDLGYISGFVREGGLALQGEWFEESKQGILFFRLVGRDALHMTRWNFADIQASSFFTCDDDQGNSDWVKHRSVTFTDRRSANSRSKNCKRNNNLSVFQQAGPFTPDNFVDEYLLSLISVPPIPPPPPPAPNAAPEPPAPGVPSAPGPQAPGTIAPAPPAPVDDAPAPPAPVDMVTFVPRSPGAVGGGDNGTASALLPHLALVMGCAVAVLLF